MLGFGKYSKKSILHILLDIYLHIKFMNKGLSIIQKLHIWATHNKFFGLVLTYINEVHRRIYYIDDNILSQYGFNIVNVHFKTFLKVTYQNSEIFWKFRSETSLTQSCQMGYSYFGLDFTLARATHMRRRYQCQIQSHCAILFGMWFWKFLNVIERDSSLFFPFSHVQDHYLCATLRKYALLSKAVAQNELIQKHHCQRRTSIIKTTMCRFNPR